MLRKIRNIISILLLIIFILPSFVRLEHHHNHGYLAESTEHPSQEYHNNCSICNFEFSLFLSVAEDVNFEEEDHSEYYIIDYLSAHFQNLSRYNFLLRAPPSFQVL
jgi:hypothetical protein